MRPALTLACPRRDLSGAPAKACDPQFYVADKEQARDHGESEAGVAGRSPHAGKEGATVLNKGQTSQAKPEVLQGVTFGLTPNLVFTESLEFHALQSLMEMLWARNTYRGSGTPRCQCRNIY